jgi:hypothetical protein
VGFDATAAGAVGFVSAGLLSAGLGDGADGAHAASTATLTGSEIPHPSRSRRDTRAMLVLPDALNAGLP